MLKNQKRKEMNKTLKAFLMGYVKFKVKTAHTEKIFSTYNEANEYCQDLIDADVWPTICFEGFNIWKGKWLGFYTRSVTRAVNFKTNEVYILDEYMVDARR